MFVKKEIKFLILIVGGVASGKREYVKVQYNYTDADMADGELNEKPVIYNLQELVADNPSTAHDMLPKLLQKDVVICCEVGSGIIPAERHERDAREATGRLCILLAKHAEKVIRLTCGIPIILKG